MVNDLKDFLDGKIDEDEEDIDFSKLLNGNNRSTIMSLCPTLKINLESIDIDNPSDKNVLVGIHLPLKEYTSMLKFDLDKLYDDTMVYLDIHHCVTILELVFSALKMLKRTNVIKEGDISNAIIAICNIIRQRLFIYSELELLCNKIVNDLHIKDNDIRVNMKYLMKNIWFLTYTEIDRLYDYIISELKEEMTEDGDNETA